MQRNSIAFAIKNDGAKSERTDRMFGLDDLTAVRCHCGDRFV
jgi:hypothetical protein